MNIDPKIWGPSFWDTFHTIASTYDDNPSKSIQEATKQFIQSIPIFLPCKECQDHAFAFIKKSNLNSVVSNKSAMFLFFFNFHNEVNKRLNKPVMSYKNAVKKYSFDQGVSTGPFALRASLHWVLGMALIVLLIYVYFFRRLK